MKIKSIKPIEEEDRYDIEVEDNHNFYANNILVHNCRCIARRDGLWSRNGKPFNSVPHIEKQLESFFKANPNAILDGELYCDKLANNFNKIISLVKKSKPNKAELAESAATIQYWVYDTFSDEVFSARFERVWKELSKTVDTKVIVKVATVEVNDQIQLDALNGAYIADSYEGQMVRIDKPYEQKRSKFLLKRKEFDDTEFELIDIFEGEGNRSGMAGYATIKHEDGRIFKSPINGNQEWLKELLVNAKDIRGKMVTIRHFKRTPDGIPRFPKVTSIRDYE